MNKINTLPNPISDRQVIDGLAEDLIGTSHYHHMPGMRVWDMNAGYWTRLGDAYTLWPPRAQCTIPDLLDHATIGCLMQQAWRIVEHEKAKAIKQKQNYIPYMINSDLVMNNIKPPPAVSFWADAMRYFCLNGLADQNGIKYLVDVFTCVS